MGESEMNLPPNAGSFVAEDPWERIFHRIKPQWYMDPPPFIIRDIDDRVRRDLYARQLQYREEVARLEAEMIADMRAKMGLG